MEISGIVKPPDMQGNYRVVQIPMTDYTFTLNESDESELWNTNDIYKRSRWDYASGLLQRPYKYGGLEREVIARDTINPTECSRTLRRIQKEALLRQIEAERAIRRSRSLLLVHKSPQYVGFRRLGRRVEEDVEIVTGNTNRGFSEPVTTIREKPKVQRSYYDRTMERFRTVQSHVGGKLLDKRVESLEKKGSVCAIPKHNRNHTYAKLNNPKCSPISWYSGDISKRSIRMKAPTITCIERSFF